MKGRPPRKGLGKVVAGDVLRREEEAEHSNAVCWGNLLMLPQKIII